MVSQGAKPLGRQKETQIVGFIHVVSSSECSDKSVFCERKCAAAAADDPVFRVPAIRPKCCGTERLLAHY